MFRTNRAFLLFISLLLVVGVAGCGSGASTTPPAPQGFTNANFSGTYSFAYSGSNTGNGAFVAVAGSLVADGNGNITGGVEDLSNPGVLTSGVATGVALTGTYNVRTDGRTVANLSAPSLPSPLNKFLVTFVLLNPQKGLIIQFDSNATGSGTIDQQSSAAFNLAGLAGAFAFSVAGVNGVNESQSSVGLVNTDNAGNITGGTLDDNNFFTITPNTPLSASTIAAPSTSTGRGTLTVISGLGTRTFAYYIVDGNHLKLVEIDSGGPFLAGDAFRSTTTVSGSFAFTQAGVTNANALFLFGAILNTDGAGNILNTSVEDLDNGGSTTAAGGIPAQGTYTPVTNGRSTMTITSSAGTLNLVFYPSTAGLLMLDVTGPFVSSGTAIPQTGAPFSNGSINNGYGLNFTGQTATGGEIDGIAQFNANGSGTLTGAMDANNGGATSSSLALSGSYTVNSNGRGTAQLRTSLQTMNLIFYMGSNSQVQFIELDESLGQVSVGNFQAQ